MSRKDIFYHSYFVHLGINDWQQWARTTKTKIIGGMEECFSWSALIIIIFCFCFVLFRKIIWALNKQRATNKKHRKKRIQQREQTVSQTTFGAGHSCRMENVWFYISVVHLIPPLKKYMHELWKAEKCIPFRKQKHRLHFNMNNYWHYISLLLIIILLLPIICLKIWL